MSLQREGDFPVSLKLQVRKEQRQRCAYCGTFCDGVHTRLEIHHKIPLGLGGDNDRSNAIGLCGYPDGCHPVFDRLAFKKKITFDEVIMDEAIQYKIKPMFKRK